MKTISEYLKKIYEEKLLAKEDDGGAPAGDISSPSDIGQDASDLLPSDTTPPKTGLTTQDVLGKCDHKKDGVFGPGCFHLPVIWSVPYYRLNKKKKKRKLPFTNLVKEDEGFEQFSKIAEPIIKKQIELAQSIAKKINEEITISYKDDYVFEDEQEQWISALDKELTDNSKCFNICVNLKSLYSFLFDNELEDDLKELELQLKISMFNSFAHALIKYFEDQEIFDFELSPIEEEKIADEFGKYAIKKYSGVYNSKLADFIRDTYLNDDILNGITESKADEDLIKKIHDYVDKQLVGYQKGSSPDFKTLSELNFTNTDHWASERDQRRINVKNAGGLGSKVIARYTWNKNHPRGPEFHYITDNAIIIIVNVRDELTSGGTKKIVTELVARPGQLDRYLYQSDNGTGRNILTKETAATKNWNFPDYVYDKAIQHQKMGLNKD